jgi:protein CWC15
MTTAHRPTWKAAVGRASEGGFAGISALTSVRDVAGHTKLKIRAGPQTIDKQRHLQQSLLKLEQAQQKAKESLRRASKAPPVSAQLEAESRQKLLLHDTSQDVDDEAVRLKYNDADNDDDEDNNADNKEKKNENRGTGAWSDIDGASDSESDLDADSSDDDDDDNSDLDDRDSDNDDSEDEEAALQAELAKIKQEREAVKQKQFAEQQRQEQSAAEEAALTGNPLLNPDSTGDAATTTTDMSSSGKLKRKWNDDVVFRNQARSASSGQTNKRFINDTVRNDFHKRFLNKFIR